MAGGCVVGVVVRVCWALRVVPEALTAFWAGLETLDMFFISHSAGPDLSYVVGRLGTVLPDTFDGRELACPSNVVSDRIARGRVVVEVVAISDDNRLAVAKDIDMLPVGEALTGTCGRATGALLASAVVDPQPDLRN